MKIRTVFFGSAPLSAACLAHLINDPRFDVVAVVCQPDNPKAKKHQYSVVKELALKNHLLCLQPQKVREIAEQIATVNPDIGALAAYGQFIPEKLINVFPFGILNVHPSLLPKYRGAAPVQHAVWNGETKSGITIMRIVKQMDAGPWCMQKAFVIDPQATTGQVMDTVCEMAPPMLAEALVLTYQNKAQWTVQDESEVTFAPLLTPEQEQVNWQQPATQIVQHMRAFAPDPAVYTLYALDARIKLLNAEVGNCGFATLPGTINCLKQNYFCVQTQKQSCVHVTRFLLPGKKPLYVAQYRGTYPFKLGDRFINGH